MTELKQLSEFLWEIPKEGSMKVPARLYVDKEMIEVLKEEEKTNWSSLKQLKNMASLPGIQKHALAMPDVHPGYGSPIGGAAAFDLNDGVITFGIVGFDINCLSGETRILDEFGATRKIKEFKETWKNDSIKCVDTGKIKDTCLTAFMAFTPKNRLFEIVTESGKKIIATEDHPFKTQTGMIELKKIKDAAIAIYSFEGNEFEEPTEKVLVDEKKIKKLCSSQTSFLQVTKNLKNLNLLPLKPSSKKFPLLVKLMGYALGDGCFYFNKKKKGSGISFYGKKNDLHEIKKDLKKVGFKSYFYSRKRMHKIKTSYSLVEFERTEESVRVATKSFSSLMLILGLPDGNKTIKKFVLPSWLIKSPKWIKRLFLASFFGAELTTPCTITNHGFTLNQPVLSMNKRKGKEANARKFLLQIRKMLKEFGIKSDLISEREEYTNAKGEISIRLRLVVSGTPKNLIKLYGKIGFEYNKKRSFYANAAKTYLELKEKIVNERSEAEKKSLKLRKEKKLSAKKIYDILKAEFKWVNFRFIERSIYERRKTQARIAFNFQKFDRFLNERTKGLGKSGEIWEKIVSKKEIEFNDLVYDFTVKNKAHNFIANSFVVSNCGVRTLRTGLSAKEINSKKKELAEALFREIPAGLGVKGELKLNENEIDELLEKGAEFVVKKGYGIKKDLEFTEENGCVKGANPEAVSLKAKQRQFSQVGTLGSGNHYLEVQEIEELFDEKSAKAFGLNEGECLVSIHCGSRALGHQIGTDYLEFLDNATRKYKIKIPDKELVCAPIQSEEGKKYFSAVNAGINCAFANRQVLTHLTRTVFSKIFGIDEKEIETVYDVGHNTAKIESHKIDGKKKKLLVQRKGATRGFGPAQEEVPSKYRVSGQPVLIGGSMGTNSFILKGTEKAMNETFGSTIHGAGRAKSRTQAKKETNASEIVRMLEGKGIIVKGHSFKGLEEEAPEAYKNILDVVEVVHRAGISEKVAKLRPMICIKG